MTAAALASELAAETELGRMALERARDGVHVAKPIQVRTGRREHKRALGQPYQREIGAGAIGDAGHEALINLPDASE
jgi:predicted phosphoribosyltransferase